MRKVVLVLLASIFLYSCLSSNDDAPRFELEFLKIDSSTTPDTLRFGRIDTISIKYKLPNNCYQFNNLFYQIQDTTRIVAVRVKKQLDAVCSETEIDQDFRFLVNVSQTENYVFRFFNGFDANGQSTFNDVVIPVK